MAASRISHGTMGSANTVTRVTLPAAAANISVFCRAQSYCEVYFTTNGKDPTVAGDDVYIVVAGSIEDASNDLPDPDQGQPGYVNLGCDVRMISLTASVPYTVFAR